MLETAVYKSHIHPPQIFRNASIHCLCSLCPRRRGARTERSLLQPVRIRLFLVVSHHSRCHSADPDQGIGNYCYCEGDGASGSERGEDSIDPFPCWQDCAISRGQGVTTVIRRGPQSGAPERNLERAYCTSCSTERVTCAIYRQIRFLCRTRSNDLTCQTERRV